jgi:type IV pilus assembly protein PilB
VNEFEQQQPPSLRTVGNEGLQSGAQPLGGGMPINAVAELVVDLLAATGLVPPDKLALVRGRAQQGGSLSQAILDEGVATSEGIARALATRFQLPLVDLAVNPVDDEATKHVPLHVLERVVAIPYVLEDGTLRVAVADPSNVHAMDELRLATRFPLEIGVAGREDIEAELRRLVRTSEAFGARAMVEEELGQVEEEEADDLEVDDGISDAPLVRLVNSVIFQAAEDGASDIHFEPQEDALIVRFRIDGVLQEVQRIPKRMTPGVTTRLKVLAKLDIAERRKPQDGRISLNAPPPDECSTSVSRPCRRSRASRSSCVSSTSRRSRRRSRRSASPWTCRRSSPSSSCARPARSS